MSANTPGLDTKIDELQDALAASRSGQPAELTGERADLLQSLRMRRYFLRYTVRGLDDEQAARRTTAGRLCLGGLIKHVARGERNWARFIVEGPSALDNAAEGGAEDHARSFEMLPGETLAGLLDVYEQVARETDELVMSLADLDAAQPLPPAPWFEPGARWSARQVLLHIIEETAQHSGHADILRESLDGQRTMG
ncbi:MAG TPA: DinB family protein [Kineosporiaceae bacterium]|nr:DinB family protein [Kineosporiaceae bacterium]